MPKAVSVRGQAKRLSVHPIVFLFVVCLSTHVFERMCVCVCVCPCVHGVLGCPRWPGGYLCVHPTILSICLCTELSVCLPACMPACLSREYWDAQGGQPEGAAKAHRQNKERTVIVDGYQVRLYVGCG
jgi:hypothetical protein